MQIIREDIEYSLDGFKLTSGQNDVCHFILKNFGGIITSQAGAGKTLTSLCIAKRCVDVDMSGNLQVVILCPVKATSSFVKELTNMIKVPYSRYTAKGYKVDDKARFHIFNYSKLDELEKWLQDYENYPILLICDECHTLGSKKTKTTVTLNRLRRYFSMVIGLTATPIMNDVEALYYIVNFIKPGYFGKKMDYQNNFMVMEKKDIYTKKGKVKTYQCIGSKNEDKLKQLMEHISFGIQNSYNLEFKFKKCSLNDYETGAYIESCKGLLNDDLEPKAMSARLHDLQLVIDGSHPNYITNTLASKEKLLVTVLHEILSRNESVLIYVEYNAVVDRLHAVLKASHSILNYDSIKFITGSTPLEDRIKLEKHMPRRTITIITQAGRESVNLQKANNLIVFDSPWSFGSLIQLIGRITRMDTEYEKQTVYFLEAINTIDTYRLNIIASKIDLVISIFGKYETAPNMIDYQDFKLDNKELKKKYLWKHQRRRKKKE